jgi:hypothetical protein
MTTDLSEKFSRANVIVILKLSGISGCALRGLGSQIEVGEAACEPMTMPTLVEEYS